MGTAQYLSPEQAQGKPVTEASDLYSIGVVLFEMLTGRPPFDGDSAVAIALKHVSQPPPSPRELRPRDSAAARGRGAEVAGEGAGGPLRRGRLVHPRPRGSGVGARARRGRQHGVVRAGRRSPRRARRRRLRPPLSRHRRIRRPALRRRTSCRRSSAADAAAQEAQPAARPARLLAAVVGIVLLASASCKPGPERPCRSCSARRSTARARSCEAAGFKVDIDRRSDPAPVDTVFRQVPSASAKVDEGSTVTLFVSNGPTHRQGAGRARSDRAGRAAAGAARRPAAGLEQESREGARGQRDPVRPRPGNGDRARLAGDAVRQLRARRR